MEMETNDPVERYVDVYSNEYDTARDAWLIRGRMVVEFDEDNGEEYEFAAWHRNGNLRLARQAEDWIPEEDGRWLIEWIKSHGL